MGKADFLSDLVRSLSKSEKRHFKLFASRYKHDGEKNYMGIFRIFEKQKQSDSTDLADQVKKETESRNLAADKHYLSEMLMTSLRQFHEESTIQMKLGNELLSVELLRNKGLFAHALQKILRLKKEARRVELLDMLLLAIGIERDIRYLGNLGWNEEFENLFNEEEQTLEQIRVLNQINRRRTELFRLSLSKGEPKSNEELLRWEELMGLLDPDVCTTGLVTETSQRMRAWAHALFMLQLNKEANDMNRRRRIFFSEHPQLIEKSPKEYVVHLFLHVSTSMKAGDYKEAEDLLDEIRNQRKIYNENSSPALATEIDERLLNTEIYLYGKSGQHSRICDLEQRAETYFKEMRTDSLGMFAYNMATAFMMTGNYRKVIRWTHRAIHKPNSKTYHLVYMVSHYLQAIAHIELSDPDVALSLIASAKRYCQQHKTDTGIELQILEALRKCASVDEAAERQLIAASFLAESGDDPQYKGREEYLALHTWLGNLAG